MYQPESYGAALLFMLVSMLSWGSWANTMKLTPGWPFQAFYWDYVLGVVIGSLAWGLTLGNLSGGSSAFVASIRHADSTHVLLAIAGGAVFNVANLLLVSAIEIAGLAVAFPIGIGLALIIGVVLNYLTSPNANPLMLAIGVALVTAAILVDALAYRLRERTRASVSSRGIQISVVAGLLMGLFYPLVAKALKGPHELGPYSVTLFFAIGVAMCALPTNLYLMYKPLTVSPPVRFRIYRHAKASWHLWAIAGGFVWCTGAVFNFVASNARMVGPAASYAIGQGATMVSAAWGVFIWKEFHSAPEESRRLIPWMFLLFVLGLTTLALAPLVGSH